MTLNSNYKCVFKFQSVLKNRGINKIINIIILSLYRCHDENSIEHSK